jgi:hypothetical protein
MANITLAGILKDSIGQIDVGAIVTFTHLTTTGETIKGTSNNLVVAPDGAYSINLQYGQIRIDYTTRFTERFVAIVVVNSDSTATNLPDLLNAAVPPTNAQLLQFQTILADTVTAKNAAEAAEATLLATQITTAALIASTVTFPSGTVINTTGFTTNGDGGNGGWKENGVTGQSPSQSPAQLGNKLLNDGNGVQYSLVPVYGTASLEINAHALGVIANNVADDVLPMQAALDANSGHVRWSGKAKTSSALTIRHSNSGLVGNGVNISQLRCDGNGLIIRNDDYLNGTSIAQATLRDFAMFRKGVSTTAWEGVVESVTSSTIVENVIVFDFPYGWKKEGCFNSTQYRMRILSGVSLTNTLPNTFGLKITSIELNNGTEQVGFTHQFDQAFITSTLDSMKIGILFEHCDVVQFQNSYVARQQDYALSVKERVGTIDPYVTAVSFDNCYFDGVQNSELRDCFNIPSQPSLRVRNFIFDNCKFGQYEKVGTVTNSTVRNLVIEGQMFNIGGQCLFAQNSESIIVDINGYNLNSSNSSIDNFAFNTCDLVDVSANLNIVKGTSVVSIQGATETLSIGKLNLIASTVTESIQIPGTVANYKSIADVISFNPTIKFGGASVGVTYTTRQGKFTVSNNTASVNIYILLSSKGSSTGAIEIPIPINVASFASACKVNINGTNVIDNNKVTGIVTSDSVKLKVNQGTGFVDLTNADIIDTALITITMSYIV